jgi:ketosteroid isomerase-like protein
MKTTINQNKLEVQAAITKFYEALNALFKGEIEPMKECWSHTDDITYMGPMDGYLVGWTNILPEWELQASRKLGGTITATDMVITVGDCLAVTSNYEKGKNTNVNGNVEEVIIRVSNTFRKEDGEWKMIAHHTDVLPALKG